MKRKFIFLIFILVIFFVLLSSKKAFYFLLPKQVQEIETNKNDQSAKNKADNNQKNQKPQEETFQVPLDRTKERVLKKTFGLWIDSQTSPIQPERFRGYHTGVDFEVFSEEIEKETPVLAVCEGDVRLKKNSTGYGGVLVTNCEIQNQKVTVVYGHLNLTSIRKNVGEKLKKGDPVGFLGKNQSAETDGERKHLHLSIHKGEKINLLGYVKDKSELKNWIDPCSEFCK